MSGPYRFTQDSTRSPLDRQAQNLFPPGQGPSFKTNVNRSKTKKWVEAKKNAYDGDDWGDYDEYDEYGVDQEPAREPTPPPVHRQAQRIGEPPSRSFTDPQRQGPVHPARRNSFEADEEHRSFSTGAPHPAHREAHREDAPYGQQGYGAPPPRDPGLRQVSVAHSDASDTLQHRRDFSPSAMVQPLQTKISTASSLGQASSPSAMSPTDRTPANSGKPLPFIRPADIYKRAEEERQRERASLDASRPSLDSLSGPARETYSEPGLEKKNDLSSNTGAHPSTAGQPALPPLQSVGSFGGDFWSTNSPTQTSRNAPVASPRDDQGLRSVVDQAFTRADDQRSVPPTPKPSDVSRSNTDSTMGISPIMSRVPSSATSALKNRNQAGGDSSTPVIAEEAGETPTLVAQPGTTPLLGHPQHIVRKPSPTHSRNVSSSSLPLATPTRGESPARSPAINPLKTVPVPESAQLTSLDTSSPESMAGGLGGPAAAYANREADIASAIRLSPVEAVPGLSIAERDSQNAFLESHQNAQSPIQDTIPRSRSESPNKGRVQELAGKFGDVSQSRRGSTQSNASRNSVQSWERSQDNSRPSSPTKPGPSTERPTGTREVSFRPSLPGQWESYATTIPTPSELSDTDKQLAGETGRGLENNAVASPLGDADITPTTSKHVASPTGPSESSSDPLTGLKAAGAAIGAALQSSLGAGAPSKEDNQEQPVRDRSFGDVYVPRPVQFDRTASSVSSSIPPTPPAKDTPVSEEPPSLVPLNSLSPNQQQTPTRPAMLPQLSTLPSDQDEESDRLRKEIVASLSPVQSRDLSVSDANQTHLQTGPASSINRDSSILPSEYDSYWAGETVSPPPAQSTVRQVPDSPDQSAQTASSPAADIPQSSLLTRFSWEDRSLQPGSHDQTQGGAVMSSSNEPPSTTVTVPTIQADDTPASPQPTEPTSIPSPVSGLHVVNSAINPEAVDMPPRLSAEVSSDYQYSDSKGQASLDPLTKHDAAETGKISIPQETDFQKNAAQESSAIKSPTDKPLGSREISNIKSPPERIDTYNVTREYWANADHGLQDWISSALAASPDLASQTPTHDRPQMAPNSGSRHKPAASLSLFGKHHTFGPNNQPPSQTPGTPTPSGGAPESRPYGPGPGGAGGKITSQQMQAKGKDLLHTAGVLGGKGMTGAKGLFAKGKSRFRASGSDKDARSDSAPSSREASEEPELVTVTPRMSMDTNGSPSDVKKKRRLSSPFHRSGRSRSRPSSIALPRSTPYEFSTTSTPRDTPPRETPPAAGSGSSRPHSFHAPEAWNITPSGLHECTPPGAQQQTDELVPPGRLGVLPSPAKSAFSVAPQDREGDGEIPPIPPLPNMSAESDSHRILQSVIRYSTPPVLESGGLRLKESPLLEQEEDTMAGDEADNIMPSIERDIATEGSKDLAAVPNVETAGFASQPRVKSGYEPLLTNWNGAGSTDREKIVPQLNHSLVAPVSDLANGKIEVEPPRPEPRSIKVQPPPQQAEKDEADELSDDDLPPVLNHDPIPVVASEPDISPILSGVEVVKPAKEESNRRPRLQVDSSVKLRGDVSPMMLPVRVGAPTKMQNMGANNSTLTNGTNNVNTPNIKSKSYSSASGNGREGTNGTIGGRHARPKYETEIIGAGDVSPISTHHPMDLDREADDSTPTNTPLIGDEKDDKKLQDDEDDFEPMDETPATASTAKQTEYFAKAIDQAFAQQQQKQGAGVGEDATHSSHYSSAQASSLLLPVTVMPVLASSSSASGGPVNNNESVVISDNNVSGRLGLQAHTPPPRSAADDQDQDFHLDVSSSGRPPLQQRLSASPYQVLHAVAVEYVPSTSSFETWDQDSVVAPSHSDGSQLGDRFEFDDHDLPPVPQIPDRVPSQGRNGSSNEHGNGNHHHHNHSLPIHPDSSVTKSSEPISNPPNPAAADSTTLALAAAAAHQEARSPSPMATAAYKAEPQRSHSLLSAISSAVSAESAPISPTPSLLRSNPPNSAGRPKYSPVKLSPVQSRIIEESPAASAPKSILANNTADYDLYADHDGIVKGVQDEQGKPLRVATVQITNASPTEEDPTTALSKPILPNLSHSEEDDASRYSFERPMSFVSGPRDSNGRPQDQINRPSTGTGSDIDDIPPVPAVPLHVQNQYLTQPSTSQLKHAPSDVSQPSGFYPINGISSASRSEHHNISPQSGSLRSQEVRTPPHSTVSPPPSTTASPPPQPSQPVAPQVPSQQPMTQGSPNQSAPIQEVRMQDPVRHSQLGSPDPQYQDPRYADDPRLRGMANGPLLPSDPRMQVQQPGQMAGQDPRMIGQPGVPLPRNEYERQQQIMMMMQQNSMDPRFRPQNMPQPVPQLMQQPVRQEEKAPSRNKLSAVFKTFGKSHQSIDQSKTPPPNARPGVPPQRMPPQMIPPQMNLQPNQPPPPTVRTPSHQSVVGDLPSDHPAAKAQRRPSGIGDTGNRPQSMGTESHISHVSQESTHVQAADSRLDLRYPASPAPFHGIPPLHPPPGAPQRPPPSRASTAGVPEAGKKKRFSTLGGLFGRSSTGNNVPQVKTKLTKEEKKAQKSQKHTTAPPIQLPPFQQWPIPQQQQQQQQQQPPYGSQQHGQQGPPPGAPRPYPGMPVQGIHPQGRFPPGMQPQGIPPQDRLPQGMPPQGMPPQGMPPQGYPPQGYPPNGMPPNRMPPNGMLPNGMPPNGMPPNGMSLNGMPPNGMPPNGMPPNGIPPNGIPPNGMSPNGLPPNHLSPQTSRHQSMPPPQRVVSEGSAYQDTRQIAQMHRAQDSRLNSLSSQRPPSMQAVGGGPPDGFYKPDVKTPVQGGTPTSQNEVQQQPPPQPQIHLSHPSQHQQPQIQLSHPSQHQQQPRPQSQSQHPLQPRQSEIIHQPRPDLHDISPPGSGPQPIAVSLVQPQAQSRPQSQLQSQQPIQLQPIQNDPAFHRVSSPGHPASTSSPVQQQQYQRPLSQSQPQPQTQLVQNVSPPDPGFRRVSSPGSGRPPSSISPVQQEQRHVSSPIIPAPNEPQYDTPQIPAAYSHVHGAYISPPVRQLPPQTVPGPRPPLAQQGSMSGRQYSDPQMQVISPQVSGQSQFTPGQRHNSDSSSVSVVSLVSNNASPALPNGMPPTNQRSQKPRMSSISEATHQEKPWNLDLRAGATEQEIVRARQRQYMSQQIAHNQQVNAERIAKSPSPQPSHHAQSPGPHSPPLNNQQHQQQSAPQRGFREVLPRATQQHSPTSPRPSSSEDQTLVNLVNTHPGQSGLAQPAPIQPDKVSPPAAYPLPMSPASANTASPINPLADGIPPPPPPKLPSSPMRPAFQATENPPPHLQPQGNQPPQFRQPNYEQQPPDEPPPSYDGPGIPNDGMDKDRSRPPNITTNGEVQGREPRQRQPSIGILQHPTPATMAASPQRSSADMGADILRRQLLENEERVRREQINQAEIQRQETQREREERERARARARELERSVSGGGRVSSLASVQGSQRSYNNHWQRGNSTSARPVFELPAEEDEPVMRATSFPGQEWVPTWNED